MAIKYLSINNEVLNIDNIPKLNIKNIFTNTQVIQGDHNNLNERPLLMIQDSGHKYNDTIQNPIYQTISFLDKESNWYGVCEHRILQTNGNSEMYLSIHNITQDIWQHIGIGVKNDGTIYTVSPTMNQESNNNEIATTKWVRDLLSSKGL